MPVYTIIDAQGEIVQTLSIPDFMLAANVAAGQTAIDGPPSSAGARWSGSAWVNRPAAPSSYYVWNPATAAWVYALTLDEGKRTKRKEMRALRDKKMTNGFTSSGVQYASAAEDQFAIQVIVMQATIAKLDGVPFTIVWTAKDDSDVTLNRAGVLQLGTDLQQMLTNQHDKFRAVKNLIKAAVTIAEVEAITWP